MQTVIDDPSDPLVGLDAIDWTALHHAYGNAEDVPELIRARASQDIEAVTHADDEFFGNIWHQGTIGSATPLAARFLTRLLLLETTLQRAELAHLLGTLVRGNHRDSEPKLWREQTIFEVSTHFEAIWNLHAQHAGSRQEVLYLLAGLPDAHPELAAKLPFMIDATDDRDERPGLVMALVEATRETGIATTKLRALLTDDDPSVRYVSAVGLCSWAGTSDATQIAKVVLDHLESHPDFADFSDHWAWNSSEQLLGEVFDTAERTFIRSLALKLLPGLSTLDDYAAATIAYLCIPSLCDSNALQRLPRLEPQELTLLRQFLRQTNVVYVDDIVPEILRRMNVKTMEELRRRLLATAG